MGEDQELRYVCKLCNRRFPSGKSYGGHMRSHVVVSPALSQEKTEPNMKKSSSLNGGGDCKKDPGLEPGGCSTYGLRENPKRTWKAVDSSFPLQHESVCKQCGKGFQSLKALCGHMACHSEKDRVLKDDCGWTNENQKLVIDNHSDTKAEAEAPIMQKELKPARKRYKTIAVKSSSFCVENDSSSVSETEQEQEQIAMCLIMLSRDSGSQNQQESSDTNSALFETKFSSIDTGIGKKQNFDCVYNGDENLDAKKLGNRKSKSGVLDTELVQFENSDPGLVRDGEKRVESDVSFDGFLQNDEYRRPKVIGRTRFKVSDTESERKSSRFKCKGTELRKDLNKETGYHKATLASNPMKYDSSKRIKNDSYNHELHGESCEEVVHGSSDVLICKSARKGSKYKRASNKNRIAQDFSKNAERRLKPKKSKGHACPICLRVFKSGQALGGHKRSHFIGGSEVDSNQNSVIKQELSELPILLDLNLPAPVDDEAEEHASPIMPW